jgi:hypothetical protein
VSARLSAKLAGTPGELGTLNVSAPEPAFTSSESVTVVTPFKFHNFVCPVNPRANRICTHRGFGAAAHKPHFIDAEFERSCANSVSISVGAPSQAKTTFGDINDVRICMLSNHGSP